MVWERWCRPSPKWGGSASTAHENFLNSTLKSLNFQCILCQVLVVVYCPHTYSSAGPRDKWSQIIQNRAWLQRYCQKIISVQFTDLNWLFSSTQYCNNWHNKQTISTGLVMTTLMKPAQQVCHRQRSNEFSESLLSNRAWCFVRQCQQTSVTKHQFISRNKTNHFQSRIRHRHHYEPMHSAT